MKTSPPPLAVRSGNGALLRLEDGREIVDCISSWWVNIHGHAHAEIASAIYEQASKLEHVLFAGFTHEPAERLALLLLNHFPNALQKIFYSDNGSTAVEVALKMAFQYWRNKGERRDKFIGFAGGYHGDTIGAMSVAGSSPFWQPYRTIMTAFDSVPFPAISEAADHVSAQEDSVIATIRLLVEKSPNQFAGIFIEPLVQGAGGMRMCSMQFLQKLERLCAETGLLLIYDEVMTGFGRTGDWFACVKSSTTPDIMCISKGITGGFLPLAVTACKDYIYDSFLSDNSADMFCHGHSYTANPIACAAAIKSIELLQENVSAFENMEILHRRYAEKYLRELSNIRNIRFCGTIAAFEVINEDEDNYHNQISPILRERFLARNLLIRPLGNTVYLMPPYCIDEETLSSVYENMALVLKQL